MAKRGAPVGWAQQLRDEAELATERYERAHQRSQRLYARLVAFNYKSTWQKLLFVIKGGWV